MEGMEIKTLGFEITEKVLCTYIASAVPFSGHAGLLNSRFR